MNSRTTTIAFAALLLLCPLLASIAEAHQRLIRTEPARDAVAVVVPRELRLVFAEPVQLPFTQIAVVAADGTPVSIGELRLAEDANTILVVPIETALRAGVYTVQWATASRDGHPVRDAYEFTIANDAEGLAPEPGLDEPDTVFAPDRPTPPTDHHPTAGLPVAGAFGAESPAYVAVRWLTYLALLGVIGAATFSLLVIGWLMRREMAGAQPWLADARRRAAGVGLAFTGLLAFATVGRLYAQSVAVHGPDSAADPARIAVLLRETIWGWGLLIQVLGLVVAGAGFWIARRGVANAWPVVAISAVVLAVTPALSGHAAAMTGPIAVVAIVTDSLHVVGAAGWLGSLFVLLLAGIPAALALGPGRRGEAVAALVRAFSPTALLFAGLLILTGIIAISIHSESWTALVNSRYGATLLVKLGIFAVVFGTGAYNYLRVKPALGDDAGIVRLRRSAGVEIAVAVAVLLVTAVLVATARPYEEAEIAIDPSAHTVPEADR